MPDADGTFLNNGVSKSFELPPASEAKKEDRYAMMMSRYKAANDSENNTPGQRYSYLMEAVELAKLINKENGSAGIPAELLNDSLMRRNLLNLGQAELAVCAHGANGSSDNPSRARVYLTRAQQMIRYMSEDGIQDEQASYAILGGREHFNQRLHWASTSQPSDKIHNAQKETSPGVIKVGKTAELNEKSFNFSFEGERLIANLFNKRSAEDVLVVFRPETNPTAPILISPQTTPLNSTVMKLS